MSNKKREGWYAFSPKEVKERKGGVCIGNIRKRVKSPTLHRCREGEKKARTKEKKVSRTKYRSEGEKGRGLCGHLEVESSPHPPRS